MSGLKARRPVYICIRSACSQYRVEVKGGLIKDSRIATGAPVNCPQCGEAMTFRRFDVEESSAAPSVRCSNMGSHCEHTAADHEVLGWTCNLWPVNGPCCPDPSAARARYEAAKLDPSTTSRGWELIAGALYAARTLVGAGEQRELMGLASDALARSVVAPPAELTNEQIKKLILPLAPVADRWGTKRIVDLGKKAIGKRPDDADAAARIHHGEDLEVVRGLRILELLLALLESL